MKKNYYAKRLWMPTLHGSRFLTTRLLHRKSQMTHTISRISGTTRKRNLPLPGTTRLEILPSWWLYVIAGSR